jgi:hypothetical protein
MYEFDQGAELSRYFYEPNRIELVSAVSVTDPRKTNDTGLVSKPYDRPSPDPTYPETMRAAPTELEQ